MGTSMQKPSLAGMALSLVLLAPASAQLVATDLNPPMLDIARNKFRSDEPIEFQQADAMALPFADASFDAVVCQFSAQFFPEKEKSYREAYRVLAPGGRSDWADVVREVVLKRPELAKLF